MQIIITANKESVISEKELLARFGQTIMVGYAEPIDSSKFRSFEDFLATVQRTWDQQWQRVYGASWSGEPPEQPHCSGTVLVDPLGLADWA